MGKTKKSLAKDRQYIQRRNLFLVALAIFLLKLVIILSIRFGGWPGSDAEGYMPGAASLLQDGFFSKNSYISYIPAGYPIIIWLISLITFSGASIIHGSSFAVISVFQTLVYFGASVYFVDKLRKTNLRNLALPVALILGLNPTLSLSSMVAGYESLVASCMLLTIGLFIEYQLNKAHASLLRTIVFAGLLQSLAGFMQPRVLLIGFALFAVWGLFQGSLKYFAFILIVSSIVMTVFPILLVYRNNEANGKAAVSSQLAATMIFGFGNGATGGLTNDPPHLKCLPNPPAEQISTLSAVDCVLSWNVHHPTHAIRLVLNKTVFFWSPWSGPLANGTMARNPWLKVDPVQNLASSRTGHSLVHGWFGQTISWIWLLGGLLLLFLGFTSLWKRGGLERQISLLVVVPTIIEWLISVGTLGDHRYRIPIMGMSLFLQVAGFQALKERLSPPSNPATLVVKARTR